MLELSMVQNSSKAADAQRKPSQGRSDTGTQEPETAFETEYNAVQKDDEAAVDVREDAKGEEAQEQIEKVISNSDVDVSTEIDELGKPALSEFGQTDGEGEDKVIPMMAENKSTSGASNQLAGDSKANAAVKPTASSAGNENTAVFDVSAAKAEKTSVASDVPKVASAAAQAGSSASSSPSSAETAIVSRALENVSARQERHSQKHTVDKTQTEKQNLNSPAVTNAQMSSGGVGRSDIAKAVYKHAAQPDERADDMARRPNTTSIPENANFAASKMAVRQQYSLAVPNGAQVNQLTLAENSDAKVTSVFDLDAGTSWDARSTTQSTSQTLLQTIARAETPAMIGRQMAEALQRLPDRPVEISLNPRELGRVRMNISTAEAGITVSVLAERPETLDLMRRNIEQLASEFQALGYESVDFAFSQGEARQEFDEHASENDGNQSSQLELLPVEDAPTITPVTAPVTGLDIRI